MEKGQVLTLCTFHLGLGHTDILGQSFAPIEQWLDGATNHSSSVV